MFICEIGSSIGIFLSSANLICQSTDISEGPFDLEIMRIDSIFLVLQSSR